MNEKPNEGAGGVIINSSLCSFTSGGIML